MATDHESTIRVMAARDLRILGYRPSDPAHAITEWLRNSRESIRDFDDADQEPPSRDVVAAVKALGEPRASEVYAEALDEVPSYVLFLIRDTTCEPRLENGHVIAECDTLEGCSARLYEVDRQFEEWMATQGPGCLTEADPEWLEHYEDASFFVQRRSDGALLQLVHESLGPFPAPEAISWSPLSSGTWPLRGRRNP